MAQIFISYSRRDNRILARTLYDKLKSSGLATWFDQEAEAVDGRWSQTVAREVQRADIVIALIGSPPEDRSNNVESEIALAIVEAKPIIVGITSPVSLPDELKCYQSVDLTHNLQRGIEEIVERVRWLTSHQFENLKLNLRTPITESLLADDLLAVSEPLDDVHTAYERISGTNKKFVLLRARRPSSYDLRSEYIGLSPLVNHEVAHLLALMEVTIHQRETMQHFRDRRVHTRDHDNGMQPAQLTWLQTLIICYCMTRHLNEVLRENDSRYRVLVMPATESGLTALAAILGETVQYESQEAYAYAAHPPSRSHSPTIHTPHYYSLDGNTWEWVVNDHFMEQSASPRRNTKQGFDSDIASRQDEHEAPYVAILRAWIAAAKAMASRERKACRLMLRVVDAMGKG